MNDQSGKYAKPNESLKMVSSGIEISKPQDIAKRFTKPFDKAPPAAPG
jgi:hypothetical protein